MIYKWCQCCGSYVPPGACRHSVSSPCSSGSAESQEGGKAMWSEAEIAAFRPVCEKLAARIEAWIDGDNDIDLGEHTPDNLNEFLQSILPALLDAKLSTPT